jgi:hypothetical protein
MRDIANNASDRVEEPVFGSDNAAATEITSTSTEDFDTFT